MLQVGQRAPDFEVQSLRGEALRLSALRSQPTWLAFFRFASCPLCNYRVHEMIERWSMFADRDFHMIGVFQSPASRLRDFVARQEPPFTLVADPDDDGIVMWLHDLDGDEVAARLAELADGPPLTTGECA